jgi:hypothetical protein
LLHFIDFDFWDSSIRHFWSRCFTRAAGLYVSFEMVF